MSTYRISVWDHEANDWHPMAVNLKKWELRPWIRILDRWYERQISMLVERED